MRRRVFSVERGSLCAADGQICEGPGGQAYSDRFIVRPAKVVRKGTNRGIQLPFGGADAIWVLAADIAEDFLDRQKVWEITQGERRFGDSKHYPMVGAQVFR